jgi:hypothetical protein
MVRQEYVRTSSSNQAHYGRTASVAAAIGVRAGMPHPTDRDRVA